MNGKLLITFIAILLISMNCKKNEQLHITDLHIHLKGNLRIEDAVIKSEADNISYGIVFNCRFGFPVLNDSQIDSLILLMKNYPKFYADENFSGAEYALKMIRKFNLKQEDFFQPERKSRNG